MMKKLAAFVISTAIFIILVSVCSAESGLKLYWEGDTYTIDQAVTTGGALSFDVAREGDVVWISDESAGIIAFIRLDTLDNNAINALRDYYNDKKSTGDQLFDRYVKLMRSYIPAFQDLYRTSYLYGEKGDPASESGMRLFYNGSDTLFGQQSAVYVYNIYNSDRLSFSEETHIDLSIPVKDTRTLLSIGFVIKSGNMDEKTIAAVTSLLGAIRPDGLPPQTDKLSVFGEKNIMDVVNNGFYPSLQNAGGDILLLQDVRAGFSLSIPSGYVPYMQNSLGGRLQYSSFKIDPNDIFSVSAVPLEPGSCSEYDTLTVSVPEAGNRIKEKGSREINGIAFDYIKYDLATTEGALYVSDYFTSGNSTLYKLQLRSRFEEPSPAVLEDFNRILESFRMQEAENESPKAAAPVQRYTDREDGYGFSYPGDWRLTDVSENAGYDKLKLVYPGLSGALDVTVSEGELYREIYPQDDLSFIIVGQRGRDAAGLIKSYRQPFDGSQAKLLDLSFRFEGSTIYAYRLMDYLDPNRKNRLAYCIDIIKGKKIYSMFITIGEYETDAGRIKGEAVDSAVNAIAYSFRAEDTPESAERAAAGETRNGKVVFIENWMKANIDQELKVASVEDTAADGSIYIQAVNTAESGYYKIKPDFKNLTLQILDRTLNATILKEELVRLKETYEKRIVAGSYMDEASMTIRIDSRMDKSSPVVSRTYKVNVSTTGGGIKWEAVRANHAEELKKECKAFLSRILSSDIDMQFSYNDVFKDIEAYEKSKTPYRALVHVKSGNIDGFFILEIDPSDDDITLVSIKSMEQLTREIGLKYGYAQNGYEATLSGFDSESFSLKLALKSKKDGSEKMEDINIRYNQEKMTIDYDRA